MRIESPSGEAIDLEVSSVEQAIVIAVDRLDMPVRTLDNRLISWGLQQDGTVLRSGPLTPGDWVLVADGVEDALAEIDEAIGEVRRAVAEGSAAETPHLMTKLTLLRRTGTRDEEVAQLEESVRSARRDDVRGERSRKRSALAVPIIALIGLVAVGALVFISLSGTVDRPDPVFEPDRIENIPAIVDGEISVRGELDRFEVDLDDDQAIQINLNGGFGLRGEFDAELRLYGPSGAEVAWNDDFNGLNSRIVYVAVESGTHVIEAGGLGGCCIGSYQLTVDPIEGEGLQGVDIEVDLPFDGEGAIQVNGVYDRYRVTLAAGQAFRARAFGGLGGFEGQFDMEMRVYDEDRFELAYNDDWDSLDPRIDFVAAVDGVYTVEVGGLGGRNVGGYRIQIDSIDANEAEAGPFFGDGGLDGGFDPGFGGEEFLANTFSGVAFGVYEGMIGDFGAYDEYDFELIQGQAIRLSLDAAGDESLDPHLRLYDEFRVVIAENDDFNSLNSRIEFIAPRTAVYTVRASGLSAASTGEYQLTIEEIDPASVQDGGLFPGESEGEIGDVIALDELPAELDGELSVPGEFDIFEVTLSEGQAVRVELRSLEGSFDPYLVIRDNRGFEVAFNDDWDSLDSRIDFVVAASGIYTIEARSLSNFGSGPYSFSAIEIDPSEARSSPAEAGGSGTLNTRFEDVSVPYATDGELAEPGHVNEFSVFLAAGDTIVVSAVALESYNLWDFDLELIIGDPTDTQVAWNDDREVGVLDPLIVYTAEVDGVHVVQVRSLGGASAGTYFLSIDPAVG